MVLRLILSGIKLVGTLHAAILRCNRDFYCAWISSEIGRQGFLRQEDNKSTGNMSTGTYLINLRSSRQRLFAMTEQLEGQGISFQRIEAVDGRGLRADQFDGYDASMARWHYGRPMSGPEVGCFLSHRRFAEEFLRSEHQLALVLEDDTFLPCDLLKTVSKITECLQNVAENWDVVNLGNPPEKYCHRLTQFFQGNQAHDLSHAFYFPLGTFALLWSRSGAEAFLDASRLIYAPIDQFLRDWCAGDGNGYALSPPLIGVDRSQSYIRHRLSDRLKLNLPRYWMMKNVRLLRNQRRARRRFRFKLAENQYNASGGDISSKRLTASMCP
jgi:glycosyl transferase family 25